MIQGSTNIAYANLLGDPVDLQRAARVHAHAVHVQPRLQGRHDPAGATSTVRSRTRRTRKPFLQYDLTKSIMFKVANITSFALKPIATPGNASCTAPSSTASSATPAAASSPASRTVCCSRSARCRTPRPDHDRGPGFNYGPGSDHGGHEHRRPGHGVHDPVAPRPDVLIGREGATRLARRRSTEIGREARRREGRGFGRASRARRAMAYRGRGD